VKIRGALVVAVAVIGFGFLLGGLRINPYIYFAGYVVLQYVVIATAWNVLGGYAGYVNFGTPAFFALGAYTSIALREAFNAPLPVLILCGGLVAGLLGLGIGYLTLRLKGVFFSIATFALSVVLQTLIINWDYVGGAKGYTLIRPPAPFFRSWAVLLFILMVVLAVVTVLVARTIERSWIGRGLAALRDNEEAAECMGVPTLRLKLFATTISGFFLGVAGAPFPYYVTYVEPSSTFDLNYAVNALAMPMIGGTTTWLGPVVGAILLGTAQQVATVTISSELNLLIVGVVLVLFVVLAPEGLTGLVRKLRRRRA
jgi:branched-chain amino acid transport system permease protein